LAPSNVTDKSRIRGSAEGTLKIPIEVRKKEKGLLRVKSKKRVVSSEPRNEAVAKWCEAANDYVVEEKRNASRGSLIKKESGRNEWATQSGCEEGRGTNKKVRCAGLFSSASQKCRDSEKWRLICLHWSIQIFAATVQRNASSCDCLIPSVMVMIFGAFFFV
jgi:hypothetical protein